MVSERLLHEHQNAEQQTRPTAANGRSERRTRQNVEKTLPDLEHIWWGSRRAYPSFKSASLLASTGARATAASCLSDSTGLPEEKELASSTMAACRVTWRCYSSDLRGHKACHCMPLAPLKQQVGRLRNFRYGIRNVEYNIEGERCRALMDTGITLVLAGILPKKEGVKEAVRLDGCKHEDFPAVKGALTRMWGKKQTFKF